MVKGNTRKQTKMDWDNYDVNVNKYKVKVGTTLEFWQESNCINSVHLTVGYIGIAIFTNYQDPNRDTSDDSRQIQRWLNLAGPNGRFRKRLVNMVKEGKDSPAIRQTLQHWAFRL